MRNLFISTLICLILVYFILNVVNADNVTLVRGGRGLHYPGIYNNKDHQFHGVTCNNLINQKEGWINSPNFPNNYPDSSLCSYEIVKCAPDVCQLEVLFTYFDLEHSPQCTGDYLDLDDGLGRLCGFLPSNSKKTISFPLGKNKIRFIFHSDGFNSRKGFQAQVRQVRNSCFQSYPQPNYSLPIPPVFSTPLSVSTPLAPPRPASGKSYVPQSSSLNPITMSRIPIYLGSYCDIYIGDVAGDIRSPNHPETYPSTETCSYTIHRGFRDICQVELTFHRFDLGSRDVCNENVDHLKLPDGSLLCGHLSYTRKTFWYSQSSDYMMMHFLARDGNFGKAATGFWIQVKQLRHSCAYDPAKVPKCDQLLAGQHVHARSPNFPSYYGPSQHCAYFIEPFDQNTCAFEMNFLNFRVEPSFRENAVGKYCYKDFVHLPDGERICGSFKGSKKYYFPKERDRLSLFYFYSDGKVQDTGFDIEINQLPNSCSHLHPDTIPTIKPLTFVPKPYQPPVVNTTQPQLPNCDRLISSGQSVISTPNYPQFYPSMTRCIFTIFKRSSNVCQLNMHIEHFDIESTDGCRSDYLLIEPTGERLCGTLTPETNRLISFPRYSDQLRLIFNSDRQIQNRGFEVRLDQLENSCANNQPTISKESQQPQTLSRRPLFEVPTICGSTSSISSVFTSDNYPLAYNSNTNCVYRINKASPQVCRVEIYFDDFDVGVDSSLSPTRTCQDDYVEIDGRKFCGRRRGERVVVNFPRISNQLIIKFFTDGRDRFGGFLLQLRQLDDNCPSDNGNVVATTNDFFTGSTEACNKNIYDQKSLQIISPSYQTGQYDPFLHCDYVIQKYSKEICALQIQFNAFAVEESRFCQKDYLQIGDGQRICGKLPYGAVKTYEFRADQMHIRFHTDAEGSGQGFVIVYNQIKC